MSPEQGIAALFEATKHLTRAEVEEIVYAIADEAESEGYATGLADGEAGHDS